MLLFHVSQKAIRRITNQFSDDFSDIFFNSNFRECLEKIPFILLFWLMCFCLHFCIPGFPRPTATRFFWPLTYFFLNYLNIPPLHITHGTVEVVREAGHRHLMTLARLLTSDPQVWSSTSCWWVTRPSGTRTSTACTPRSRRGRMITPAQSGTLSPPRSWPLVASSDVSRDDNTVPITGQEPDQPDADSQPRQENQGGGGAEASLDLPERAGGLCVPQVRQMTMLQFRAFWQTCSIIGKRRWIAWRNSMQDENWRERSWQLC